MFFPNKEEADKNNREVWTISFLCKLYQSKSIKKLDKSVIKKYEDRIHSEINKRLFSVLIGENNVDDLSMSERSRFLRLTGAKNVKS